jgi:hypothetical protein
VYEKKLRPLGGYLNLAALFPLAENLPQLTEAPAALVDEVARRWDAARAERPELGLPVIGGRDANQHYQFFIDVREIIGQLVAKVTEPSSAMPPGRYRAVLNIAVANLPTTATLSLTASGVMPSAAPLQVFINVLQQTGPDIWSLRRCPRCTRPFLPYRSDQKACSLSCADTMRTRRARGRKKAAAIKAGHANP